jgi:hypothetical protein
MFSVYRPQFLIPEEGEPRLRYVFSWFTFIRWDLAPIFNNRFRADWQSEFATAVDQLRGQKDGPPPDFTAAVSDDAKELAVWRLDLCADVQATACAILAEELKELLEAIERRLEQLPADLRDVEAPENKNRRGRKPDPEAERIVNAWRTGKHETYADCAKALDLKAHSNVEPWKRVRNAVDAANQRERRRKSPPDNTRRKSK